MGELIQDQTQKLKANLLLKEKYLENKTGLLTFLKWFSEKEICSDSAIAKLNIHILK